MRKTICASVLVLVMCVSASAGEIMNPPIVAAPPGVDNSPGVTRPSGDQPADGRDGTEATDLSADAVAAAAMTVLDALLALL